MEKLSYPNSPNSSSKNSHVTAHSRKLTKADIGDPTNFIHLKGVQSTSEGFQIIDNTTTIITNPHSTENNDDNVSNNKKKEIGTLTKADIGYPTNFFHMEGIHYTISERMKKKIFDNTNISYKDNQFSLKADNIGEPTNFVHLESFQIIDKDKEIVQELTDLGKEKFNLILG